MATGTKASGGRKPEGASPKVKETDKAAPKRDAVNSSKSSRNKLYITVAVVLAIIVLALISAFGWPGWAIHKSVIPQTPPVANASAKPTIKAEPLPQSASELMKALPEHSADFVRGQVENTDVWREESPLEEYKVVYSNGNKDKDATVTFAQWSGSENAQTQYELLAKALTGTEVASGNIKVSGKNCGTYVVKSDGEGADAKEVAVWRNDTVVFKIEGPKSTVDTLYQLFPI